MCGLLAGEWLLAPLPGSLPSDLWKEGRPSCSPLVRLTAACAIEGGRLTLVKASEFQWIGGCLPSQLGCYPHLVSLGFHTVSALSQALCPP